MAAPATAVHRCRRRVRVTGVVQGVGFRPFVYALARELGLSGSVGNTADGVVLEVEGALHSVDRFTVRLVSDAPALAVVEDVVAEPVPCRGGTDFVIESSRSGGGRTLVSPDVATCPDCLAELSDPADRRFGHAFISCTNCGPRFTIVRELPYDRPATTMADLPLCGRCAAEYVDPADRRFHAQTVACPDCGPTLVLHHLDERVVGDLAVTQARRLLAAGEIVAVKGLGGFHLACDATNQAAVATLRKRKDRGDKPFALMVADLETAEAITDMSADERALLGDVRRPVVLVPKRTDARLALADAVAPDSPDLGVMLAYTPLHHLLFTGGDAPQALVMTSGNLAGEPIVIDDTEARARLAGIADAWLGHDRPIQVPCDDSVVRVAGGEQLPVRRSRGYAPMPVALPVEVGPALAVGGDLKNTFCLADGRYAWLSAHVGDMDDLATLQAFEVATAQLSALTRVTPQALVADRHPSYRSSAWATRHADDRPVRTVQHHHAHIASAMAENGHDGRERVIGFAFDGTGYGDDGAVWGGEVLLADYDGYERAGHLRYAWLPGGDSGVRNPCRMALSHLLAAGVAWDPRLPCVAACSDTERRVLARQLERGLGCAPTSSMGRLFDAMSSLAGVCHRVAYEAEAAMRFEGLARAALATCGTPYAFGPDLDPSPVLASAADDVLAGVDPAVIAGRFHLAVVDLVADVAALMRQQHGLHTVAMSGGVFLNALLTALCSERLRTDGFRVLRHRLVPPSDAGLALGQIVVGARRMEDAP
ncbi:MAG: hydrogenase maturation protein HypF [Pseudonocardiales bacterium]|nr:hydrogenase maturation protein HypF [Pseudonocardiales bacterium]